MTINSSNLTLTIEDKRIYDRDGVVCVRNALSNEEVEGLRDGVSTQMKNFGTTHTSYDFEAIARQVFDSELSGKDTINANEADRFDMDEVAQILRSDNSLRPIRDEIPGNDEGMFFYDAAGWRFHKGFREAALDSYLPKLITELLDTKYLNFWEDTTFVKAPNTAQRTSFHQDYGYFQIRGKKCCVVWIPLDSVNSENGPMEYIRGSHLWGKKYAPNLLLAQSTFPDSPYERTPDIESNPTAYDIVSFDVNPGDVIIHDVLTIHGSRGNASSDRMRRAVSFRYCGDDITYFDRPGAIVQPYLEGKLKDGDTLMSKDYPVVWPRPFPQAKISQLFEYKSY